MVTKLHLESTPRGDRVLPRQDKYGAVKVN
jgi:hypothetical protein